MPPNQEPEDFIPLTDSNLTTFETTSQPSTSPSPEPEDWLTSPFTPSTITRTTIQTLVTAYPSTVEKIYRQKLLYKVTPQPTKGEKKRAQRAAGNPTEPVFKPPTEADLDKGQLKYVENEMEKFRELDGWRYEHFPGVLGERVRNGKGALEKEEIIRVMDWKTKHGLPRPTLMGMIKTNKEKAVQNATSAALASLPSPPKSTTDDDEDGGNTFPNISLDKLSQPLRGVGPATASLILSIATCPPSTTSFTPTDTQVEEIPFYSDDIFLWLVLCVYPGARKSLKRSRRLLKQVKPNGELNVKYNMHEYRELWTAVRELRERLATESTSEGEGEEAGNGANVSTIDIEKAAFVIRHLDVSGLDGVFEIPEDDGEGGGNEEEDAKERAKLNAKAKAKEEKDRKKEKEKEREMERKEKRKRDELETPAEKKERKKRKYNNRR